MGTHDALLYRTFGDYVNGVMAFLAPGLLAGDPVFVAVPAPNAALLRAQLPATAAVTLADMMTVGRNPACIIPAIRQFLDAHPGRRARFVGEPIWPDRSAAEVCEATRHEAMLNTVFGRTTVDILCPYDIAGLDPVTVADAWRTHPDVIDDGERRTSERYVAPESLYDPAEPLLPIAPETAEVVAIGSGQLSGVRDFVRSYAARVGLACERSRDLVLAVSEIANNTLMHTAGPGTLRIWCEPRSVICEIRDSGHISDYLAGRHRPAPGAVHGRGLWIANHLCDLVQIRSTAAGTVVRLSVDLLD